MPDDLTVSNLPPAHHARPPEVDAEVQAKLARVAHWREQVNQANLELNVAMLDARTAGAHVSELATVTGLGEDDVRRVIGARKDTPT